MIGILDIVDSIKQIDSILFPFIAKKRFATPICPTLNHQIHSFNHLKVS